jgi:hypothetical protein
MQKRKHKVGKKTAHRKTHRKGRKRIGAISKSAISETAVIAGAALGTSLALGYVSPMVDSALQSVLPDTKNATTGAVTVNSTREYLLAGAKIALGIYIGGSASGSSKNLMEGVGVGMVINGGGSLLGALLTTPKVAGTLSRPVLTSHPTIGRRYRVAGPVLTSHPTIGGVKGGMKMGGI